MTLTIKQKRLADEYIICGNATEAYLKAGYSKKYAGQNAAKILKNPKVKEYIADRLEKLDSEKIEDQEEALETLTNILRRDETEQVVVTLRKPTKITMKSAKGTDYDKFAYEDTHEVVDVKPKLSDTVRAAYILIKLGKIKADTKLTKAKADLLGPDKDSTETKIAGFLDKLEDHL